MIELKYENVNPCKLQDELIASGLIAGSFITFDLGNDTAQIQFNDDVDLTLVKSVVAKHDKTPIPAPKTEIEVLGEQLVEKELQVTELQGITDMLGVELVNKDIALLEQKQITDTLGQNLVNMELKIINLEMGGI